MSYAADLAAAGARAGAGPARRCCSWTASRSASATAGCRCRCAAPGSRCGSCSKHPGYVQRVHAQGGRLRGLHRRRARRHRPVPRPRRRRHHQQPPAARCAERLARPRAALTAGPASPPAASPSSRAWTARRSRPCGEPQPSPHSPTRAGPRWNGCVARPGRARERPALHARPGRRGGRCRAAPAVAASIAAVAASGSSRCCAANAEVEWATSTGAPSPRRRPSSATQPRTSLPSTKQPSKARPSCARPTRRPGPAPAPTAGRHGGALGGERGSSSRGACGSGMARTTAAYAGPSTVGPGPTAVDLALLRDRQAASSRSSTSERRPAGGAVAQRPGLARAQAVRGRDVEGVGPGPGQPARDPVLDDRGEALVAAR